MADALSKLNETLNGINKTFGAGSIMMGEEIIPCERISSRSIGLDYALGGGFPKGRVVEIYGPESSGKTTLTLHTIAEVQSKGGTAAFIDAEHAFDPEYATNLGVDMDKLILSQPDYGEQALEIAEKLASSGVVDLIVIDSIAALTPKAELDGDMESNQMGLLARMMSKAMRKLVGPVGKTDCCLILLNQLREKLGIVWGTNETTPGGNAVKFASSIRVDIRKSTALKDGEEVFGNRVKVKVIKNKTAPPFRKAEFDILYGQGVVRENEIFDLCVDAGIVKKSGSWFSYGDTRLGQGRDNVLNTLKENPDLFDELETQIKEHYGIGK
jgi:recombination protein RecA